MLFRFFINLFKCILVTCLLHIFAEERTLPPGRKLLILINPFSGSGKSLKIFHEQVESMLNEASIEFNQRTTGR